MPIRNSRPGWLRRTRPILVSGAVAEVLGQLSTWSNLLHDLGEAEVKHGVRLHVYNLHTDAAGNPELPHKLRLAQRVEADALSASARKKIKLGAIAAGLVAMLGSSTSTGCKP